MKVRTRGGEPDRRVQHRDGAQDGKAGDRHGRRFRRAKRATRSRTSSDPGQRSRPQLSGWELGQELGVDA
jgi:hypothetical protein